MNFLRCTALPAVSLAFALGVAPLAATRAHAEENLWPVAVAQTDDAGNRIAWQAAGPLFFEKPGAAGETIRGFRPLYAEWRTPAGLVRERTFLYPLFFHRTDGETYRWSVFNVINRSGDEPARAARRLPALTFETFDVWPFWFSRDTGAPESSYRALFPFAGKIKSRFGYDQITFGLFPFYARTEKRGTVTTSTPWPFLKISRGTERGFSVWPLFGALEQPGAFHREFYLWPLIWNNTVQPAPDAPAGTPPRREVGVLPFFTRETAAGFVNENYLWPFFGYTDRVQPRRYRETRYFWPFLVQGRGDDRLVNRWGPFYTHSVSKGVDKRWLLWPVFREKNWTDAGVAQRQQNVLYFLYASTQQRSLANPSAAPADKTHLWPLLSKWDNGAGRKQAQFPSPLEVFFPDNERIRTSWSPLFSLYRYDRRSIENVRHELLWGFISWQREPQRREFHLGPLLGVDRREGRKRVTLGNGLLGWQRSEPTGRWRMFWFDFPAKVAKLRPSAR